MEGATGHPQSLADAITMEEFKTDHRPKVVLSWAPHPKALLKLSPILCANDAIARRRFCHYTSEGYELNPKLLKTPRLSTIRIKHLKMLILSTLKLEQLQRLR
jgi:N-succinyl-L-ornithine transcarbamylase